MLGADGGVGVGGGGVGDGSTRIRFSRPYPLGLFPGLPAQIALNQTLAFGSGWKVSCLLPKSVGMIHLHSAPDRCLLVGKSDFHPWRDDVTAVQEVCYQTGFSAFPLFAN
jgi:hypothetical protein